MSKIIMTGDVHLGVGSRLSDIVWSLNVMSDYASLHDIDTCLCLGDLYHDRDQIGIDVLCESHKFFTAANKKGQRWIAFPGNHDMFLKRSWNYTSIEPLSELITVIDSIKILQLDGRRFWILPFVYSESAYMKLVKKIQEFYEPGDVLLTHIGIRKAIKNVCFLLQDWSYVDLSNTKFDQIFTGHFHTYQQVGDNLWYVGSPIPFKADEGDVDHGFIVYDLDTREHEFVSIWEAGRLVNAPGTPPPQYLTLSDELLGDKTATDVGNCIIRVALSRVYSPAEKDDIRNRLLNLGARRVSFFDLIIEDVVDKPKYIKKPVPTALLFPRWLEVDNSNLSDYRVAILRSLNEDIMTEGDERYQKLRMEE